MEPSTVIAVALGGLVAWQLSKAFLGKIAPAKARALVETGARLVDVRSAGEHAAGHIGGSTNIPLPELGSRLRELDKGKPVIVYCASGMRSASAARVLKQAGFAQVHDLGAMARWG